MKILKLIDKVAKPLVWLTVVLYLIELTLRTENSLESPMYFLWAERIIAGIFTLEYLLRLYNDRSTPDDHEDFLTKNYVTSPLGIIDLMSVLPFWIGFFVPISWTGMVRTLRIIRFGKFFRYSRHLQLVALGFCRAWPNLKPLLFAFLIVGIFNTVLVHELEKKAQPDSFGDVGNCAWYVLVSATTVGYGDMSPATAFGKLAASFTLLIPALMIYASIVGVVGAEFVKVVEEERDPSIDPLALFHDELERQRGNT